jgi:hypothetical protein
MEMMTEMDRIDIDSDPKHRDWNGSADRYEVPEVIDYGTLQELTLSGSMPLTDSFNGSSGGS